jgi:hypothetical protein
MVISAFLLCVPKKSCEDDIGFVFEIPYPAPELLAPRPFLFTDARVSWPGSPRLSFSYSWMRQVTSAFGGEADILFAAQMSAFDPKRTSASIDTPSG